MKQGNGERKTKEEEMKERGEKKRNVRMIDRLEVVT